MVRENRVQRYQRFLRSLKRPPQPPKQCWCPAHAHPRPWVPPPCRTTKPIEADMTRPGRRAGAILEMPAHSCHQYVGEGDERHGREEGGGAGAPNSQSSMHHLYTDARILKDALNKIRQGDQLSKDAFNTVKKWSKTRLPEAEYILERSRQRKGQSGEEEKSGRRVGDVARQQKQQMEEEQQEEERLRAELRNLRELSESNEVLLRDNRKLMKKVQRLQQQIRRQEVAGRGSRETVAGQESTTRGDYILLSLQKKYDDLLQYVLKVESENQKLKSLAGVSEDDDPNTRERGGEEGIRGADRKSLAALHTRIEGLQSELLKKDEYIAKCEQHLHTLKENMKLQESLRVNHTGEEGGQERQQQQQQEQEKEKVLISSLSLLEGEWTRRLAETREMYDSAILGYKEQIHQMQLKMEDLQSHHNLQIQEMTRKQGQMGDLGKERKGGEGRERERENVSGEERESGSSSHQKYSPGSITADGIGKAEATEKYKEALDLIVTRLDNLQVGRSEVETTLAIIKDTIKSCLQEWREKFLYEKTQHPGNEQELKAKNEELHKKLQNKIKKVESLQKKYLELEQENTKLLHQISLTESRVATAQATSQLDVLQGLPKKLHETEQALIDTKELLHKAHTEKRILQDQASLLEEKLSKKENKLKSEREQSASKEDEVAGLRATLAALQQQVDEKGREVAIFREQVTTKDTLLEQTSAQLEERIRECARLTSHVERYKHQKDQETGHLQSKLQDQDFASHKQFLEAQAQVVQYQAQLSTLRAEKEQSQKSLRSQVRKLEEQVDQLNLKNSTLQRQLNTITSTFHSMFTSADLNPPTSPHLSAL